MVVDSAVEICDKSTGKESRRASDSSLKAARTSLLARSSQHFMILSEFRLINSDASFGMESYSFQAEI
jgi:hypothetical protein